MILYRLIKKVYHWLLPFKHGPLWGYRINPAEPDTSSSDQHPTPHHRQNRVEFMVKWPVLPLERERYYVYGHGDIRWPKISLLPKQQFGFDFLDKLPLIAQCLEAAPGRPFIALIILGKGYYELESSTEINPDNEIETGVWCDDYLFKKLIQHPMCAHMTMSLKGIKEADFEDPLPCICFLDGPLEEELALYRSLLGDFTDESTIWLGTLPDHYNLCEVDGIHHNYKSPRPYIDNWFLWKYDRIINGKKKNRPPDVEEWLWENRSKLGCFFSMKFGSDTAEAYFPAGSHSESIFINHLDDLRKSEWKILGLPTDFQG